MLSMDSRLNWGGFVIQRQGRCDQMSDRNVFGRPVHPILMIAHMKVLIWMWHSPLGLQQSPNSFCRSKFKVTVALLKIAQELILELSCSFYNCTSILKVKFQFWLMFLEYSLFFCRISGTESVVSKSHKCRLFPNLSETTATRYGP